MPNFYVGVVEISFFSSFSKHQSIVGSSGPPSLADGTPSLVDFSSSKNNRFVCFY